MLESPGARQKLIGEGLEDFVCTRPADALSPNIRSVILESKRVEFSELLTCIQEESDYLIKAHHKH